LLSLQSSVNHNERWDYSRNEKSLLDVVLKLQIKLQCLSFLYHGFMLWVGRHDIPDYLQIITQFTCPSFLLYGLWFFLGSDYAFEKRTLTEIGLIALCIFVIQRILFLHAVCLCSATGGGAGGVKVEAQEEEEERRNVAIDVGGKNINMALNELAMINRHTQPSHLSFLPRMETHL